MRGLMPRDSSALAMEIAVMSPEAPAPMMATCAGWGGLWGWVGIETPREGFEPSTCGLEVRCSIQLSYRGFDCPGGCIGAAGGLQ